MQKTASGCLITVELPKQIATTERGPRGIWLTAKLHQSHITCKNKGIKIREGGMSQPVSIDVILNYVVGYHREKELLFCKSCKPAILPTT